MLVRDYMKKNFTVIGEDATIADAVKKMVDEKTNSLIVVNNEKEPIGTLSSHTLIKNVVPGHLLDDPTASQFGSEGTFDKYAEKSKDKKVSEIMHTDFHTLTDGDAMIEAAAYSVKSSRRILPVVNDEKKIIGVITRTCIKKALHNILFKDSQVSASSDE